jgi:hypothetical protein
MTETVVLAIYAAGAVGAFGSFFWWNARKSTGRPRGAAWWFAIASLGILVGATWPLWAMMGAVLVGPIWLIKVATDAIDERDAAPLARPPRQDPDDEILRINMESIAKRQLREAAMGTEIRVRP